MQVKQLMQIGQIHNTWYLIKLESKSVTTIFMVHLMDKWKMLILFGDQAPSEPQDMENGNRQDNLLMHQ